MSSWICAILFVLTVPLGLWFPGVLLAGLIYTYAVGQLVHVGSLSVIYTIAAVAITIIRFYRRLAPIKLTLVDCSSFSLIFFLSLSYFWSADVENSASEIAQLLLAFSSVYAIVRLQNTPLAHLLRQIFVCVCVLGVVVSVAMLNSRAGGTYASEVRLLLNDSDASAVGLSVYLPFAIYSSLILVFTMRRWWLRILGLLCFVVVSYTAIVSSTRSVFLAAVFGILVTLLLVFPRVPAKRIFTAALSGAALVVLSVCVSPQFQESLNFDRIFGNFRAGGVTIDASSMERIRAFQIALDLIGEHPLLGVGFGAFGRFFHIAYPHNMFLEVGSAGGLPALTLAVLWVATVIVSYLKIYQQNSFVGAIMIALYLIAFIQMQVSFAFWQALPLFIFSILSATYSGSARRRPPALLTYQKQIVTS